MPYLIVQDMPYIISKWIIPPIYKLWLRKVEGIENIPKDKPFIVAANHTSYYDALLLPSIIVSRLNKKIHALVNSFYWKIPITGFFLDLWESIPVSVEKDKNSKEKNKKAIEKALSYLKNNELIMLFPEGTRSDGKLKKAYIGVAKLALKSKALVLPCGIISSNKVLPKGKVFPRFARCEVKIGKPISFEEYYNKKVSNRLLEEITRTIMKQIAKLTNQKYNY